MKLVNVTKSPIKTKKYRATFDVDGKEKHVDFGATGYEDFTTFNKDEKEARKQRYLKRHQRNENWDDPLTAGALSRWILWNKHTIEESIRDFKRRFKL